MGRWTDGHEDGWMGAHRAKTGGDESTGMTGAAPRGIQMSCRSLDCPTGPVPVGVGRGIDGSAWWTNHSGFGVYSQRG